MLTRDQVIEIFRLFAEQPESVQALTYAARTVFRGDDPKTFYEFDPTSEPITQGYFAQIFSATQHHHEKPESNSNFVVKYFFLNKAPSDQKKAEIISEIAAGKKLFLNPESLIVDGKHLYFVMAKIPGVPLYDNTAKITDYRCFSFLNLEESMHLILQAAIQIYYFHCATLTTPGYLHLDIKSANVLVSIDESPMDLRIVDPGLSEPIPDSDPMVLKKQVGTEHLLTQEIYFKKPLSTKTDMRGFTELVYDLVPSTITPRKKSTMSEIALNTLIPKITLAPVLRFPKLGPVQSKDIFIRFLYRMAAPEEIRRPTSLEALTFFLVFNNLLRADKIYDTTLLMTRLYLISRNLWAIGTNDQDLTPLFSAINLDLGHIELCRYILDHHQLYPTSSFTPPLLPVPNASDDEKIKYSKMLFNAFLVGFITDKIKQLPQLSDDPLTEIPHDILLRLQLLKNKNILLQQLKYGVELLISQAQHLNHSSCGHITLTFKNASQWRIHLSNIDEVFDFDINLMTELLQQINWDEDSAAIGLTLEMIESIKTKPAFYANQRFNFNVTPHQLEKIKQWLDHSIAETNLSITTIRQQINLQTPNLLQQLHTAFINDTPLETDFLNLFQQTEAWNWANVYVQYLQRNQIEKLSLAGHKAVLFRSLRPSPPQLKPESISAKVSCQ